MKTTEKLCACNNCNAIMIDMNPADQPELTIDDSLLVEMAYVNMPIDEEDSSIPDPAYKIWACPNCLTDANLTDVRDEEHLKTFMHTANDKEILNISLFLKVFDTPFTWDEVEYNACRKIDEQGIEQCEPEEAEFWSVYLHRVDGGLDCIADCDTELAAKLLHDLLINAMQCYHAVKNKRQSIEVTWSVEDIMKQATDDEVIITEAEALDILHWMDKKHDASIGINWDVISTFTEMYLQNKGRSDYQYSTLEYKDEQYVCREIKDQDHPDTCLTVAPYALLEILKDDYGNELEDCDLDETIAYYAKEEEIILSDDLLYELIYR